MLGLAPSTYDYYEHGRVPPADVLVKIADIAGVDLRWLLTGQGAPAAGVLAGHPVLQRAGALLADRPQAAKALEAFLDVLTRTLEFPQKEPAGEQPGAPAAAPEAREAPPGREDPSRAAESWIPVLGRSAAGVPQFWSPQEDQSGLTTLEELISRHASRCPKEVRSAEATGLDEGQAPVQVIALPSPKEQSPAEFVVAPGVKRRHPDAFAVRIDGESMSPDIRHGDLVLLSPSAPATDGKAAVVQLDRQIGVTCKLYRREGKAVHLVPINELFPPQSFPASKVVWALRVLGRVRA